MLLLTATDETLELITGAAVSTDWAVGYADVTTTAFTPGSAQGNVATATTTAIVGAPGASTQRQVKRVWVRNRSTTAAQTVTLVKDVAATEYRLTPEIVLQPGETLEVDDAGTRTYDRIGRMKVINDQMAATTGRAIPLLKVGTATEAAGVWYSWGKDTGAPGAWAPGTPGVAGRATDGTAAADAGCLPFPNASTNYLTGLVLGSGVTGQLALFDVLWVNSGIAVTTTTAQTINSVAFPARDANGSTNGEDVEVGILVTAATTNAGAITNTTLSYTNSDGTAGRTATIASFPATGVIGTFVAFQLAAGDKGVRSIQTVTLGTSYGGGAISLVAYRRVAAVGVATANVAASAPLDPWAGARLYDGACLIPYGVQTATTAATIVGIVTVTTR